MIPLIGNAHKRQIYINTKSISGCLGLEMETRSDCQWANGIFVGDGKFLKLDCDEGCTTL